MRFFLCSLLLLLVCGIAAAQPGATPAAQREQAAVQRQKLKEASIVNSIAFRSAGPTVFSGRVVDLDVNPADPTHFYVAYASGGLWVTHNNGTSFEPIFDKEAVMTIGDIAVNWKENIIWLGTGEVNSSRSTYAGNGLYKSSDGGKTWQYAGLPESHHIGRIVLHPDNPDVAWVAVMGHLYTDNPERGVYLTRDGGKTWSQSLAVNDRTGAIDLVIHPRNPDQLFAAMWERDRKAWNFTESGPGSGIYGSSDGGQTWQPLTTGKNGFPTGEGGGRIGLDLHAADGNTTLFAVIDNYFRREKEQEESSTELSKDQMKTISREAFLKLDDKKLEKYLRDNNFPDKYSAESVRKMVEKQTIAPAALAEYLEDANSLLFDTPVIGAEVYRSDDMGKTWKRTHDEYIDQLFYSYGYYFGQVRINPLNTDQIYLLGVPVIRSDDGGKTFVSIDGDNVHSDHHALWVNPKRQGHLILGNDGGVNISYDNGEHWIKCNTPAVGQFYAMALDMAKPYRIYGGLQDNGVWMGPSNYRGGTGWHDSGQYPYKSILGGDGMQVAVDTRDNRTVYTGFQFGNYFRIDNVTGERKFITPKHELGERPLRWNWQAPVHLSQHNQDILYIGANKLFRSLDKGENFTAISGDLTQGGKPGDVPYGTLTTIHESPLQFGLLYTGSDDGKVHISRDGGFQWTDISAGLPADLWVSRVQASAHDKGLVYVTLNGYRWDDFGAYLYRSKDYGNHWERIGTDLPEEPINVIKEDPENPELLYVGTDHGLYVTLDGGMHFMLLDKDLPAVAIHDLAVHPRDKELVLATHGRSFYVAGVQELQQLTPEVLALALKIFSPGVQRYSPMRGNRQGFSRRNNDQAVQLPVYSSTGGTVSIKVKTGKDGIVLQEWRQDMAKGLHYLPYDLTVKGTQQATYQKWLQDNAGKDAEPVEVKAAKDGKIYLLKGKYTVEIQLGNQKENTLLELK